VEAETQMRIHPALILVFHTLSACSGQEKEAERQLSLAEAHANVIEEANKENLDVIGFDDKKAAVRTRDNLVCLGRVRLRDRKTKREGSAIYFSNDAFGADFGANAGYLLDFNNMCAVAVASKEAVLDKR
jgi:hypothetical protein